MSTRSRYFISGLLILIPITVSQAVAYYFAFSIQEEVQEVTIPFDNLIDCPRPGTYDAFLQYGGLSTHEHGVVRRERFSIQGDSPDKIISISKPDRNMWIGEEENPTAERIFCFTIQEPGPYRIVATTNLGQDSQPYVLSIHPPNHFRNLVIVVIISAVLSLGGLMAGTILAALTYRRSRRERSQSKCLELVE
jgi:hypothetical protein